MEVFEDMPLPPDIIKRLSDLASRLDEMGFHSLADRMDGMCRSAASVRDPFRKRRNELFVSNFQKEHQDLILRATALEKMLGAKGLPDQILKRWMDILSDPQNREVLERWLRTGEIGHLGGPDEIKDPEKISSRSLSLPGSWAIEDSIAKHLGDLVGERLSQHSFLDKRRSYEIGRPDLSSQDPMDMIDADYRGMTTGRLYEMKEARGEGPYGILEKALPNPKRGVDSDFDFLVTNLRNLSRFHIPRGTQDTMRNDIDVSLHHVGVPDVREHGVRKMKQERGVGDRPFLEMPEGYGEIRRVTMNPFELEDAIRDMHGEPGSEDPQWKADLESLTDQVDLTPQW